MNGLKQTDAYRRWEASLKDKRVKTVVMTRLLRLSDGHTGDVQSVGEGISELRIHGPGYRIYYQRRRGHIVLLLCAGAKGSQSRDILLAKFLAKNWVDKEDEDENNSYRL